jgi:hypothetical protein
LEAGDLTNVEKYLMNFHQAEKTPSKAVNGYLEPNKLVIVEKLPGKVPYQTRRKMAASGGTTGPGIRQIGNSGLGR